MEQTNEKLRFCTQCGSSLRADDAFCAGCGAKVTAAPVEAAPVQQPESAPEPVVIPASAPAPAAKPAGWTLPLVPIILMGMAALYTFIMMCIPYNFFDDFMKLSGIAAVVVGMILFKENKNLLAAIGFFVMAFLSMIDCFGSLRYGPVAYRIFAFLFLTALWAAEAAIGLTYLLGKEKLANLKTLAAAVGAGMTFLMMIIHAVAFPGSFGGRLLAFLFCAVPVYGAAILYTPYKK